MSEKSILQDWILTLPGLRHQGVLLTAVRGCDTSQKNSVDKAVVRAYRYATLNPHCGHASKAQTFIEECSDHELKKRLAFLAESHDHLPHHYLMHLIHAAEIVGYYHPDHLISNPWRWFYEKMCSKMHMMPESKEAMDFRLTKEESAFFADQ